MATIRQRIELQGGDDIRAKLRELARIASEAFQQIQNSAEKIKVDPAAAKNFEELATVSAKVAGEFGKLDEGASKAGASIKNIGDTADETSGQFQKLAESETQVAEGLSKIAEAGQQIIQPVQESAESSGAAYAKFGLQVVRTGAAVVSAGADMATAGAAVAGVGVQAVTAAAAVGTFALSLGSTLVSAIGLAVPALAGLAKGLAGIASSDAKLAETLTKLQQQTKDIGLNFAGLQRAQAALEQVGFSGEQARSVIAKLAEELKVKPDEAGIKAEAEKLESKIKQLEFEREIIKLQMDRGIVGSSGAERIQAITEEVRKLDDALARMPSEKAKGLANDLAAVTQAMREVAAGAKGMTFSELTTAETKISAVKDVLKEVVKQGGNVVQAFANIIANLPKADALQIGKAFGLSEVNVQTLQRYGVELGKIDELTKRLSEAGVVLSPGDAGAFDAMGASLERLSSAWERLKQSLASSVFSRLAAEGATAFANMASAIIEETAKVIEAFNFVFSAIVTEGGKVASAFASVLSPVTTLLSQVAEGWMTIFRGIGQAAAEVGNQILQGWGIIFQKIGEFVTTPIASAWEWVKTSFQSVLDWVAQKWAEFKAMLGLGGGKGAAPAGASGGQFAGGGLLGGRGTGTSDSNLAWVSRGEYITPARAVRQPGVLAFLEALRRSGGNLRDVLDGMGRFALGGLVVPSAIPAMAGGGSMHPVTINFAGTTVSGLRASSDVVEELRKAAVLAQVRSGGRKPSRYS